MGAFADFLDDVFGIDPSGGGIFDFLPDEIYDAIKASGFFDDGGETGALAALAALGLAGSDFFDPNIPKVGYQGGIPEYTAVRRQVPVATGVALQGDQEGYVAPMGSGLASIQSNQDQSRVLPLMYDPNRRPGSGGRRYFTDVEYVSSGRDMGSDRPVDATAMQEAQNRQDEQAYNLLYQNLSNLAREERSGGLTDLMPLMANMPRSNASSEDRELRYDEPPATPDEPPPATPDEPAPALPDEPFTLPRPTPKTDEERYGPPPRSYQPFSSGGITALKKGQYLNGNTDGMADKVPATIDGKQPAALSDGEFVIPADVVSHLGNGNSDAGAKVLEQMMARVRKERTGNKQQGKEIKARQMLPA